MTVSRLRSPLLLAGILYLLLAALGVLWLASGTGGRFIYPLDDTYISMAMAKNWALYGVMGVTRWEFSASSSCPLWTLLITAVYWLAGVNWWAPLLLSGVAGLAVLVLAHRILMDGTGDVRLMRWALVAACLLIPLPALGLSGMEHTLHMALVLPFVFTACRYLGEDSRFAAADLAVTLALAPVLVMVRYESLFLVALFAGLALLRRRWAAAVLAVVAAAAPVLGFGWYSMSQGWAWLPNSVLLKGGVPAWSLRGVLMFLGLRCLVMLALSPHMLALLAGLLAMWKSGRPGASFWHPARLPLLFVAAAVLLQMQFASGHSYYRYEAYLVVLAVVALVRSRFDLWLQDVLAPGRRSSRQVQLAMILVAVGTLPLWYRAAVGLTAYPAAAHNVFEQQYQMARFVHRYFDGASVAANDIGAINYFNDLRCLDLVGLANRDVFRLKRKRAYTSQAMEELARRSGVRIAMVYDTWFDGLAGPKVPASWTRAGEWRIADNQFLGGDTVTFYAVEAGEFDGLVRALREFGPRLPKGVAQSVR